MVSAPRSLWHKDCVELCHKEQHKAAGGDHAALAAMSAGAALPRPRVSRPDGAGRDRGGAARALQAQTAPGGGARFRNRARSPLQSALFQGQHALCRAWRRRRERRCAVRRAFLLLPGGQWCSALLKKALQKGCCRRKGSPSAARFLPGLRLRGPMDHDPTAPAAL